MIVKREIHIGTSGFSYNDWLGNFYPQFCSPKDFLRFYATVFNTVEIDSTFYGIPTADTIDQWKRATPDGFIFAAKFPRSVTHEGSLDSRMENMGIFLDLMRRLENKLGPLLMQFPYSFAPEQHRDILQRLVESIPSGMKIAVEVRNRKWLVPEFYNLLAENKVSLGLLDHPWMPKMTAFTADFAYIRLLGDREKIESDYSYIRFDHEEELQWWKELIDEFSRDRGEVYVFLNNHYSGNSPATGKRLIELLGLMQSGEAR